MNTSAPPHNDPTTGLWSVLRDFVVQAFCLFGAPHEIAQRQVALRSEHKLLLVWLRQCETLLRRLLCLDALMLIPSLESGPPASSRQRTTCTRRFHEQDPENSETWRVSFRVIVSSPASIGDTHARRSSGQSSRTESSACVSPIKAAARFCSTWPAAERFEALIRAFNDPAPYVRRLARMLKRNAGRIRAFTTIPPRVYGKTPLEEPIANATRLIRARKRQPDSS